MVTSLSRNGSSWCWHISWQGRVSPWLHLISQGAEVTSSPTPPGFYGPARAIPVHTGMDAGHREPCSIPSLQIVAIAVCRTSSSLDRQMDTLGSSTCDCWVQEATSRCSHTTGCSSAAQQVLQDGKSKTQRCSKTPAEQDHVHSQGCCVGSREPRGSRAPSPPGAAPGTPLQLLYEEGRSAEDLPRGYSQQSQDFCLPCLCLLCPGPFPREGA